MTWIFSTQSNLVLVGVAYVWSFLTVGDTTLTLDLPSASEKPAYVNADNKESSLLISEDLKQSIQFQSLRATWRAERGITSSIHDMCTTPAYLKIIGMGKTAVPLLIGQLREEGTKPDHWFFALNCITGEDPVRPEDRGRMAKMSEAWIAWAEQQAYG